MDIIGCKTFRLEVLPRPMQHVFVLIMSRIHDCLEEFNVSMYPAAILRRACSLTISATRIFCLFSSR